MKKEFIVIGIMFLVVAFLGWGAGMVENKQQQKIEAGKPKDWRDSVIIMLTDQVNAMRMELAKWKDSRIRIPREPDIIGKNRSGTGINN